MLKKISVIFISFVLAVTTAACGGANTTNNQGAQEGGAGDDQPTELTMWMFTGTGLEDYIKQYDEDHPEITVTIQAQEYADHHNAFTTALAAGSGAPDISLIEVSYIDRFKAATDKFYNLREYGAGDIMDNYLDWKVAQATTADGDFIIGVPTDIGPMAMVYREDLFAAAGLPTDRNELEALMPTWEAFIDTARKLKEATGVAMIDSSNSVYDVIKGQQKEQYFNEKDELIIEQNEGVRRAFDLSAQMANEGLTANIATWSPEWGTGMNNGDFAVMLAPAWMLGVIKGNAPDTEGKWDIAQMPEGSGNWGGSFLTVPKESKHPKAAYELISWLLAPERQLELFKSHNVFPSTPAIYDDPAIQTQQDPFFGDAPLGEIFSAAALKVVPVYYGPKYMTVETPMEEAMDAVEKTGVPPEQAWNEAMERIKRDLSR
jgi:cellobiose transport system substrate-binding protein